VLAFLIDKIQLSNKLSLEPVQTGVIDCISQDPDEHIDHVLTTGVSPSVSTGILKYEIINIIIKMQNDATATRAITQYVSSFFINKKLKYKKFSV
jgi:hypothetical protein